MAIVKATTQPAVAETKQADLTPLGKLWKHTDKNGGEFMSGTIGEDVVFLFTNRKRPGVKDADYQLFKVVK